MNWSICVISEIKVTWTVGYGSDMSAPNAKTELWDWKAQLVMEQLRGWIPVAMVAWNQSKKQLIQVVFSTFQGTHPAVSGGGNLIREAVWAEQWAQILKACSTFSHTRVCNLPHQAVMVIICTGVRNRMKGFGDSNPRWAGLSALGWKQNCEPWEVSPKVCFLLEERLWAYDSQCKPKLRVLLANKFILLWFPQVPRAWLCLFCLLTGYSAREGVWWNMESSVTTLKVFLLRLTETPKSMNAQVPHVKAG